MITLAEFNTLKTESEQLKTELEGLRKIDVSAIKAEYDKQIQDLNSKIEEMNKPEFIQATEVYKQLAELNTSNETKISELTEENKNLQESAKNIDKNVNLRVMEKLASIGVDPIKPLTKETNKKNKAVFSTSQEYFDSMKQ